MMLGRELLQGRRLKLTVLRPDDAEAVAGWYGDAEFLRLFDAAVAFPLGVKAVQAKIEAWQAADKDAMFALRRIADQTLIGIGGITAILWSCQVGWLDLALGPEYWNQRYGTEGLALILRYAFQELNLHRVQLTVFEYNKRAVALYEKAGFVHEGTYREFGLRDGERYNMLLMGLLRQEWEPASQSGATM